MKNKSPDWVRLAVTCERTRVQLRTLEAKCRLALKDGADPAGTLKWAAEFASAHAAAITAALKDRVYRRQKQDATL